MSDPATITPQIIEALYSEALVLSDDVRRTFTLTGRADKGNGDEDLARLALSCEGLRTTTRMMHAVAWLLTHRAYFNGEVSEFQLRNRNRLSANMRHSEPEQLRLLAGNVVELVEATRRLYDRLLRLDQAWRLTAPGQASAIERLHLQIERRLTA